MGDNQKYRHRAFLPREKRPMGENHVQGVNGGYPLDWVGRIKLKNTNDPAVKIVNWDDNPLGEIIKVKRGFFAKHGEERKWFLTKIAALKYLVTHIC